MPLKEVRFVRGRIRGVVKDAIGSLVAMLNYNAKVPAGGFFTVQQATDAQTVLSDLRIILAAKRVR